MDIKVVEEVLRSVYTGILIHQINNQIDLLLSKIERTLKNVYGNEILLPIWDLNGDIPSKLGIYNSKVENICFNVEIPDKLIRTESSVEFMDGLNDVLQVALMKFKKDYAKAFYTELDNSKSMHNINLSGLKALFDTDAETLYGIPRHDEKTKDVVNPQVEILNEFDPVKIINVIEENCDDIDFIVCNKKIISKYIQYLADMKRDIKTEEINGFNCLVFEGTLLMVPADIPEDTIYAINSKEFFLYQLCDWDWLTDSEGRILKQIPGKLEYSATLVKYGNYMCVAPNNQMKIILKENAQ